MNAIADGMTVKVGYRVGGERTEMQRADILDLSRVRDALYDAGVAEDAAEQVVALLECLHAPRMDDPDTTGLRPIEKRLVRILRAAAGRIVSPGALIEALGMDGDSAINTLRAHVWGARQRNERARERITVHWAEGYSWSAD